MKLAHQLNLAITLFKCGTATASNNFPAYNQQCRDDAGPPYLDDAESFPGGGKYHDNSAATPVLLKGGECAGPLKEACQDRPTKQAYMEGPISCGNKGWYCRIMPDKTGEWPGLALKSDVNFGSCNSSDAFEDSGYDRDGHCHGSDNDSTYYWWMRDHFHRQYNGHLRCCCGWYEPSDPKGTALYSGRIANRCDYRRLVLPTEDVEKCRDANEDHNLGFDDIGCDDKFKDQIGKPIDENDDFCWEVRKFGYVDGYVDNAPVSYPTGYPTMPTRSPTPGEVTEEDEDEDDGEDEDEDDDEDEDEDNYEGEDEDDQDCTEFAQEEFFLKRRRGKAVKKRCTWLRRQSAKRRGNICKRNKSGGGVGPAKYECPVTCKTCV